MKAYLCSECGEIVSEKNRMIIINSINETIYKCPYCRGKLKEIK